jgi:hypothetical protein
MRTIALGLILVALRGGVVAAQQQDTEAPVGVMEQSRPEYDAQGVAIGDWLFFPSMAATANHDDNVFRLRDGSTSDSFLEIVPIARLQRKTTGWQVDISANADNFTYSRLSRLNLTDWTVAGNVGTTGEKTLSAQFTGYYGEYHEGFESADILGLQRSPTRYLRGHIEAGFNYQPGEWALTGDVPLDTFSWEPTVLLDDEHVSNRDRDEALFTPSLRFSYNVASGYQIFARAGYDRRDFAQKLDRFGFERSSTGYHLDGGLALAIDAKLKGEAFVGYLHQDFASSGPRLLPDISLIDYGAEVHWYPSRDLTVHLTASRSLSDIILPGVSMSDDQTVGLSVDWQLRNDIVVQGAASYTDSRLIGVPRTDRYPSAGLTLRYLINQTASVQGSYLYSGRQSDIASVTFNDQTFSVGINLHI